MRPTHKNISNENFNDFFASIPDDIIPTLPMLDHEPAINNAPITINCFFLEPITAFDVVNAIYGLNAKIAKYLINNLTHPLVTKCLSDRGYGRCQQLSWILFQYSEKLKLNFWKGIMFQIPTNPVSDRTFHRGSCL